MPAVACDVLWSRDALWPVAVPLGALPPLSARRKKKNYN